MLGGVEDEFFFVTEPGDPEGDSGIVEPGGAAGAGEEDSGQEDEGFDQIHALIARAAQRRASSSACR